ncbi:MAG TPA: hypothetical protein VF103_00015, partial [Polyangiaceae bacterium]
ADRARSDAHFRRASEPPPAFEPSPTSVARRSSGASRIGQSSLSEEVARILDPTLALGRARSEQKDKTKEKEPNRISSSEMEAVKVPPPADPALGPATPVSQRRPTVPPPPGDPSPSEEAKHRPVDPRGVTLPAMRRAPSKPPKA